MPQTKQYGEGVIAYCESKERKPPDGLTEEERKQWLQGYDNGEIEYTAGLRRIYGF
jgi:hypothetical protein